MDDKDIDQLYIESTNIKREHMRKGATPKAKKIRVRGSVEVAKDNFKAAKRIQRANIRKAKQNIKACKLMIKQARTAYKIIKLSNK